MPHGDHWLVPTHAASHSFIARSPTHHSFTRSQMCLTRLRASLARNEVSPPDQSGTWLGSHQPQDVEYKLSLSVPNFLILTWESSQNRKLLFSHF